MYSNIHGDPCPGVEKYIEIVYECIPSCPVQNVCRCETGHSWCLEECGDQSVAKTNNGMSVDLNVEKLNAAKAIIVIPTIKDVQPELSIIGTSPDFVQSLKFFKSRLKSGFCLDQIKTRFESGPGLDKIQISGLKLKIRKNLKIKKIRTFELENLKK